MAEPYYNGDKAYDNQPPPPYQSDYGYQGSLGPETHYNGIGHTAYPGAAGSPPVSGPAHTEMAPMYTNTMGAQPHGPSPYMDVPQSHIQAQSHPHQQAMGHQPPYQTNATGQHPYHDQYGAGVTHGGGYHGGSGPALEPGGIGNSGNTNNTGDDPQWPEGVDGRLTLPRNNSSNELDILDDKMKTPSNVLVKLITILTCAMIGLGIAFVMVFFWTSSFHQVMTVFNLASFGILILLALAGLVGGSCAQCLEWHDNPTNTTPYNDAPLSFEQRLHQQSSRCVEPCISMRVFLVMFAFLMSIAFFVHPNPHLPRGIVGAICLVALAGGLTAAIILSQFQYPSRKRLEKAIRLRQERLENYHNARRT